MKSQMWNNFNAEGEIRTPAFMPVGTAATVKAMLPKVLGLLAQIFCWEIHIT